ncbi:2-amino-4-hydroxy-6-hydroxymethyldihydropteridine diphosphokinase [Desulfurobacterium indicum]|uniref:2-amino-4-hydroxy-6-hydroxymethyldihydropteridine pyrophosphokinase n=1 Tax=Desulfurobacterium indicum TaxID=1914305 RepID=A0A1R1MJX7_9BACT|nr:2-amino-4-hydroxy-6-hydroxymethyldihydropteridine diphosphokinase [Desulfurobacterium indicum]OMH40066.1 2-amino-4-hydroxy-6-hydroxymethyldihydropteridine diphosphokinase [Desulfurobacterium indicum]
MAKVLLCIGTNLGNRKHNIERALNAIDKYAGRILKTTDIMETKPFGVTRQPNFLNIGVLIKTEHPPFLLLNILKRLEKKVGRYPTYRWGPRVIDIDILTYENLRIGTKKLKIPHPGIKERDFFKKALELTKEGAL